MRGVGGRGGELRYPRVGSGAIVVPPNPLLPFDLGWGEQVGERMRKLRCRVARPPPRGDLLWGGGDLLWGNETHWFSGDAWRILRGAPPSGVSPIGRVGRATSREVPRLGAKEGARVGIAKGRSHHRQSRDARPTPRCGVAPQNRRPEEGRIPARPPERAIPHLPARLSRSSRVTRPQYIRALLAAMCVSRFTAFLTCTFRLSMSASRRGRGAPPSFPYVLSGSPVSSSPPLPPLRRGGGLRILREGGGGPRSFPFPPPAD